MTKSERAVKARLRLEEFIVSPVRRFMSIFVLLFLIVWCPLVVQAEWGSLPEMYNYSEIFGLEQGEDRAGYKVTMLEANAPGNIFHPGEQPGFVFQIENLTDRPIRTRGKIDIIRYAQRRHPGDNWIPDLIKLEEYEPVTVEVNLEPKSWQNIGIEPVTPETRGGYALILDLGQTGRRYLTSYVRTFKPDLKRIQFPKQSLEEMPAPILARLGIQAIRWAAAYHPTNSRQYNEQWARIEEELKSFHENNITVVAEIGAGSAPQPLGRGRPHLDNNGVMQGGKEDLVWLPEYDDDYEQFVYRLASEFGWPNGPITGFMLWNEPWEGLSISGWGADMLRYRELYRRMGDAVFKAREQDGVDVLVGGCDSSSNTIDKLFPDGSDEFLPYLDFCSIHYQGLSSPVLYPEWNNRKHYKGRVMIWDTESWVANTDDCFAAVVATNRAAGYDRAMGTLSRIAVSTLSHNRVARDIIKTDNGTKTIDRLIESRPLAAAYSAVQQFIGEREFKEILFKNGLPWVYLFEGLNGNPDDGTVVIVGDIGVLFEKGHVLFNTVRSLDEVSTKQQIRRELSRLSPGEPQRKKLAERLREPMSLTNAAMTIRTKSRLFTLYDVYGNPVPVNNDQIVIPLNHSGYFLRADKEIPGSFNRLVKAIHESRISGLEPLEIVAYDMTAPIESNAVMRLRLTSMHNQSIKGKLEIKLGNMKIEYPKQINFAPRERKSVEVKVSGRPAPNNSYPLQVTFNAGEEGLAVHEETMHVNWISRKTINVDGELDDWDGALPQTISTIQAAQQSFEEQMWLPFEKFSPGAAGGFAVGYLAYDDDNFYFAAKIADNTTHPGTIRFETRDQDADFYPEISYEIKDEKRLEHTWPEGIRRFSYRRWPYLPSAIPQSSFDNVLIGFNSIAMDKDEWVTHLPGRMPKFIWYKTTDYEYALNKVAEQYGGGTEIWRLMAPGMPYKHFFPRQPKHPLEGPVKDGRLKVRYADGTRIIECALPWTEIPHARQLIDEGKTIKFSFRVNHENRSPDMELAMDRSAAEGISSSFHPNWSRSWPNELEFGFEK